MSEAGHKEQEVNPVIICADDYGLSHGVCDAIETLITKGRLSATSVMTVMPEWPVQARTLKSLVQEHPIDVGLHLTLTGQRRLTAFCSSIPSTLHALTGRALSRRLAPGPVRIEIRAQLDAFEDAWGAGPDYIDGHQHIHCLPVIRNELLDEVSHRYGTIPWIRDCTAPLRSLNRYNHSPAKEAFLSIIGRHLSEEARNRGFRMNDSFRGLYTFTTRQDYGSLFHKFLSSPTSLPLVHCHPGWVDSELRDRDTLTWPREREFAWLTSGACQEFMERTGIYPSRFPKQSPDGAVCA